MITYRYATIEEIDLLVELRLRELAMFSDTVFPKENIKTIYDFYREGILNNTCITILGYDQDILVTTGTIYMYSILPSNANPKGITGWISNIWTHEDYRRQGIASYVMKELMNIGKEKCGIIGLNASVEGKPLYEKLGFTVNDKGMLYIV